MRRPRRGVALGVGVVTRHPRGDGRQAARAFVAHGRERGGRCRGGETPARVAKTSPNAPRAPPRRRTRSCRRPGARARASRRRAETPRGGDSSLGDAQGLAHRPELHTPRAADRASPSLRGRAEANERERRPRTGEAKHALALERAEPPRSTERGGAGNRPGRRRGPSRAARRRRPPPPPPRSPR